MTYPMTKDSDYFLPPKMEALKGHVRKEGVFAQQPKMSAEPKSPVVEKQTTVSNQDNQVQPKIFLPLTDETEEENFSETFKESRFDYHPAMLSKEIFAEKEDTLAQQKVEPKNLLERKSTLSILLIILALIGIANLIVMTDKKTLDISLSLGKSEKMVEPETVRDIPLIINETDASDAPVISIPNNNALDSLELFKRSEEKK